MVKYAYRALKFGLIPKSIFREIQQHCLVEKQAMLVCKTELLEQNGAQIEENPYDTDGNSNADYAQEA